MSGCIRAMPHLPRRRLRRGLSCAPDAERGQMSVEMAISLPVLVICMVIAMVLRRISEKNGIVYR